MPKKKKKSSGGDGESKRADSGFQPLVLQPEVEEWVTLDLRLLNWKYMNTQARFKTSTHLFTVKNYLLERHGRIDELRICKGVFSEANEMTDEMKTLAEYGITGGPREAEEPVVVQVFYDFKPIDYDDPVLLALPGVET